jgi:hypothetical protein
MNSSTPAGARYLALDLAFAGLGVMTGPGKSVGERRSAGNEGVDASTLRRGVMLNVTEILASVRATLHELEPEVPTTSADALIEALRDLPPGTGVRPDPPTGDEEEEGEDDPEFSLVELMAALNVLDRFLWERGGRGWSKPDAAEVLELMTQVAARITLLTRDLALLYTPGEDDDTG